MYFALLLVLATNWCEAKISPYDGLIQLHARRYDLDWRLVAAQIRAESSFNPKAISPVGAIGLMQLMPGTAKWLGLKDPTILVEPETNIMLGCQYDAWLFAYWRKRQIPSRMRPYFVMASYNAGQGRVRKAQRKTIEPKQWNDKAGIKQYLPGETQRYVERIIRWWNEYKLVW